MRRLELIILPAVLTAALILPPGCAKKEKQQILQLEMQCNDLSIRNRDLQTKLAQSKTREKELESTVAELGEKDATLSEKDRQIAQLEAKIRELNASSPVPEKSGPWDVGRFADRITVGTDILFPSGGANLTSRGKAALDQIAYDLKTKYRDLPVRVYGHTDSDPIRRTKKLWADNLDLSANRAMAVTRYLTSKGILAKHIETIAMGETHYIAPNNTRANKAKNRRVEIIVVKE